MNHLGYLNIFLIKNSSQASNCALSGHYDTAKEPLFVNDYLNPEMVGRSAFQCREECTPCLFDKPNQELLRGLLDRLGRLEP